MTEPTGNPIVSTAIARAREIEALIDERIQSGIIDDNANVETEEASSEHEDSSEREDNDGSEQEFSDAEVGVVEDLPAPRRAATIPEPIHPHRTMLHDALAPLTMLAERFATPQPQPQAESNSLVLGNLTLLISLVQELNRKVDRLGDDISSLDASFSLFREEMLRR
ncbi:hypothetical protein BJV82DRAFT_676821 [Fennellomyces sp. T-0311]|nr:hypothetical protein BJV82DRAFT_676821 [Fennellomyces sp. T-0311]